MPGIIFPQTLFKVPNTYFIVFLYRDRLISTACIIVYVKDFVFELPYHVVKRKYTYGQTIAIFSSSNLQWKQNGMTEFYSFCSLLTI